MNKTLFIFLLSVVLCLGCETYDLDPFDPRLPEYSSDGSDVAGCIFNGGVWTDFCFLPLTNTDCVSLLVRYDSTKNETRIGFGGTLERDGFGNPMNKPISIAFVIKDKIDSFQSLQGLGERVLLDGNLAYPIITLFEDGEAIVQECESGFVSLGNLYFHDLYEREEDDSPIPTIVMAGTFGFHLNSECWNFRIEHGRFDYDDIRFLNSEF